MKEPNTLNLIKDHFASVAKEFRSQAEQAGLLNHPTGIGTEREETYRSFLERHVPKMCDVFLGGYVFDLKGNRSKQTDIIITGGNTPRFRLPNGNRFIAPLEGTIAVAEVKSRLDKNTLQEAMNNSLSIPAMPAPDGIFPSFLGVDQEAWEDTPYKIVFAFDGIEQDSANKHLIDFLKDERNQVGARLPNLIHVLGKYTIRKVYASQIRDKSTGAIAQGNNFAYHSFSKGADILAMLEILTTIQHSAFASNYLKYDYSEWYIRIQEMIQEQEQE